MNAVGRHCRWIVVWTLCGSPIVACGQPVLLSREDQSVDMARAVLTEIMAVPAQAIPRGMFHQAQGVAIVPNVVKGGLVVGIRHGQGVLLVRDANGGWTLQFITLTGGSIGWQVGLQSTDVILVFKTPNSVQGLMRGKLTVGADAAASAGPVGRNAAIATDTQLRSEIYSYSRSRGLFAGVALDGTSLQIDHAANAAYYQRGAVPGGTATVPPSAIALINQVAAYSDAASLPVPGPGPWAAQPNPEQLRLQVVDSARQLQARLDPQWQAYLAMPAEIANPPAENIVARVEELLSRYDTVQADPRYVEVSARPEFQVTHGLLRQYLAVLRAAPMGTLQLPPPPDR